MTTFGVSVLSLSELEPSRRMNQIDRLADFIIDVSLGGSFFYVAVLTTVTNLLFLLHLQLQKNCLNFPSLNILDGVTFQPRGLNW